MAKLQGKGIFVWKIPKCEGGDVRQIASVARDAALTHVIIKVANGIWKYNYDWDRHIDFCPPLVQSLRRRGIEPWGWHYVFGEDPIREARIAVERVNTLGLRGYVINAEAHYKRARNRHAAAEIFMRELRRGVGRDVLLALSSYRYPSLHPELPWNQFLRVCDLNMPQVYWIHAHNPAEQLEQTLRAFASPDIDAHPPIVPTGSAFSEHGWTASASEVRAFLDAARALNLDAVNFWEWHAARDRLPPDMWATISEYDWENGVPEPLDIAVAYIDALNARNPANVAALYASNAVHITSSFTTRGRAAIEGWYRQLFGRVLPDAVFTLANYSGAGSVRHLTWTADSSTGRVVDGRDTIGLNPAGEIVYHYTFFTVRLVV